MISIHPTARVETSLEGVSKLSVGPFSFVGAGAVIGDNCSIGAHAVIASGAIIGEGVRIGNYCEIRERCEVRDRVSLGSRVTLAAGTFVGEFSTIKYGFVATDTPNLSRDSEKETGRIGKNVQIGANATLMPGVSVGNDAVIGACSQIRSDVPPGEVWFGNPARAR